MNELEIKIIDELNKTQKHAVEALQSIAFTDVDDEEANEDFYHPKSAQVLAYMGDNLVGWTGIHETKQEFEGKQIKIGGYGICTHPDWQGKGIASKVSQKAMDYLRENGIDVGFLSVDPDNKASVKLHQKHGFVMLPRKFSWTNSNGVLKENSGGMIAPINSQELFEYVLDGSEDLYVGNGYW